MVDLNIFRTKDYKKEEIKRLGLRVAEIEWLLIALVLLYVELSGLGLNEKIKIISGLIFFALFIIIYHYSGFQKIYYKWKLAVDSSAIVLFISFVVWNTGRIWSPLLSLYFFAIITAAATLGENMALLSVGVISIICLFFSFSPSTITKLTLEQLSGPLILLFPFWLTAYVTTRLSKEMQVAKHKAEELSQTDPLTDLYSMRIFLILMEKELMRSNRFNHCFTIMIVDADDLKSVNDTYGHLAGDDLIKHIAKTIQSNLRTTDIVARYGGDEFIVLLPETSANNAFIAGERVRRVFEHTPFNVAGEAVQLTASFGFASYPENGTEVNELIDKADKALMKSKKAGKNRGTISSE